MVLGGSETLSVKLHVTPSLILIPNSAPYKLEYQFFPADIKIRKTWPLLPDGLAGPHQQQRRPSDDGRGPAQRDFIHGGLRQHD